MVEWTHFDNKELALAPLSTVTRIIGPLMIESHSFNGWRKKEDS